MNRSGSLPAVSRQESNAVITPMVPLNFVYPGLSLSQIISIIWGYWKVSAIIIAVVLTIVVAVLKFLPRTYEAEAAMMVNYEINDPLNGKNLPIGQVGSYIATQEDLIRNQELIGEVVDQLQLTSIKEYAAGYNKKTGTLKQWVVEQVGKDLVVYQGQFGSQLLYVRFSAKDPYLASKIANTIAETYKKREDSRANEQPIQLTVRYEQQLQDLKKNVDLAQQEVTDFYKRHSLVDKGNKANVDIVMLTTLEDRLLEAQNQRRLVEAHVSGDESVSDSVLASPEVQALKAQLAEQQLKLARMESLYTPEHPDLVDLKNFIEVTKQSLASAFQKYAANESEKLTAAIQLEKSLKAEIAKQRVKVFSNSKLHDEAEKYVLALQSAQAVYKRALDSYDELRFSTRRNYSNVSFVSRATPPLKPSKPKVIKGLLMGAVVAFMLGVGIPLGYGLFDRRVRCRDDLERDYGIPVLAELGALSTRATT